MKTAIVNIGTIVTGDWREPDCDGDTVLMSDGKIEIVGTASSASRVLRLRDEDPLDDGFADNTEIETRADSILDFT